MSPVPTSTAARLLPWVLLLDAVLLAATVDRLVALQVAWRDADVALAHLEAHPCAARQEPSP